MSINSKVLYFGYGANSQREMMEAITGNKNLVGRQGFLKGFILCVQRLDQIPNTVFPGSPVPVSPRTNLEDSWPANFESYIIKAGSRENKVAGTIWELTPQERELVRDWELVDFGWYVDIKATATMQNGQEISVETEGLRDNQEVDRTVEGQNYRPFLMPSEDFLRIAEKSRKEYSERVRQ